MPRPDAALAARASARESKRHNAPMPAAGRYVQSGATTLQAIRSQRVVRRLACALALAFISTTASALEWDFYLEAGAGWGGHKRFTSADLVTTIVDENEGYTDTVNINLQRSSDGDDAAWRVNGGVWLHRFFGLDLGYIDAGETSRVGTSNVTIETELDFSSRLVFLAPLPFGGRQDDTFRAHADIRGISLLAKTRYPLSGRVDMVVSLGAIRWDLDGSTQTTNALTAPQFGTLRSHSATALDANGVDLAYGAGLKCMVTRTIGIGVEWMRYEVGEFDEHVDFAGITASYHFGGVRAPESDSATVATPLATALARLWRRPGDPDFLPRNWSYFIAVAGGLAEHNSAGDSGDERTTTTVTVEQPLGILFPGGTDTLTDSFAVDEDAAAWRVSGGAYVHRNFGFEVGYIDLGATASRFVTNSVSRQNPLIFRNSVIAPASTTVQQTEVLRTADLSGFSFAGKLRLPVHDRIELGATLGAFVWDAETTVMQRDTAFTTATNVVLAPSGVIFEDSNDDSGVDVTYGVGLKVRLHHQLWFGLEYTRYELGGTDEDAELFGAGLEYRFGNVAAR